MALDTYSELQAAIIRWAMRTGDTEFAAEVPTFIELAESRINRTLRVSDMETTTTTTLDDDGAMDLPEDFLELRAFLGSGSPQYSLAPVTPAFAADEYAGAGAGTSYSYAIVGNNLTTFPAGTGDATLTYFAKVPALSDEEPTNWLLTKAPEVYLYGALMESAPYLMDDQRTVGWGTLFQKAIDDLHSQDRGARYSNVRARVRGPTP